MNKEDLEEIKFDYNRLKYEYKKRFSKYAIYGSVIGILIMLFFIYKKSYWIAFILWFLFFPDIEQIIRFIKKLFKVSSPLKNKE